MLMQLGTTPIDIWVLFDCFFNLCIGHTSTKIDSSDASFLEMEAVELAPISIDNAPRATFIHAVARLKALDAFGDTHFFLVGPLQRFDQK